MTLSPNETKLQQRKTVEWSDCRSSAMRSARKSLQLEIRRIAQTLGHIPSRDEVQKCSQYPISYFDDYFISWGEACAAARHAGMSESPVPELLRSQQLNL